MKDNFKNRKILIALGLSMLMILSGLSFFAAGANSSGILVASNATSGTSTNNNSTLYLSPGPSPAFTNDFNPYNIWTGPTGIMGMIYEPLLQVNTYNGTVLPWLATGYSFSHNGLYLNMTLRHNVTFSNGQPFNSYDVVYTFNIQKKAVNGWAAIENISAPSLYKVTFKFYTPQTNYLFYIGCTAIMPTNQTWEQQTNSTGFPDPQSAVVTDPIGTGPYTLQSFSPQKIVLVRNPHYWQPGLPKIDKLVYVDYTSNSALALALAEGKVQWASVFEPNVTSLFVHNNPTYNHYWYPPGQPVTMMINDQTPFLNESYVRQAISLAINRTAICQIGEYGYEPPANGANILSQQLNFLNSTNAQKATSLAKFNPSGALALLESHGFKLNAKKQLEYKNGTLVPTISLMSVSGYTDWDTDITIIASDLKAIGINVVTTTPTDSVLQSDIGSGNYQMALDTVTGIGPNPWYDYSGLVGPVTPIGKTAFVNEERWNATGTDFMSAYNNFTLTGNLTLQDKYINEMAGVMLNQMPIVPLVYSGDWYEYVNNTIGGWPNQANPYWIPMPWYPHPAEVIVLHLYPLTSKSTTSGKPISTVTYEYIGAAVVIGIVAAVSAVTYMGKRQKKRND
ncbi:MAG: ABC transporter substrate-binding protein [Cuniculiplasma sp.]